MKERWKYVKFKNVHLKTYKISNSGRIINVVSGKELHPWKGLNGYLYVALMCDDGKPLKIGVHVLVAEHSVRKPRNKKGKLVPNHLNFDRTDNNAENLKWTTYAENNLWNYEHGHYVHGDKSPTAKVSNELVHEICKLMESGYTNRGIRELLSLKDTTYNRSLLTRIRTGKEWKEISSKYNISVKNSLRQLDDKYIERICKLIQRGKSLKEMRKILKVPESDKISFKNLVMGIKLRRSYKDISYKYKW